MLSQHQPTETKSSYFVAKSSQEVLQNLADLPHDATVFIDVDDTLITPCSKTFRKPPHNALIDNIKKHKDKYTNYQEIVSNWRLQRKPMLIDQHWPQILAKLTARYKAFGLTKLDTGKFGNIESMEKWRYAELRSLGLEFSKADHIPEESINNAAFYKGIFITGTNSKSQTICHYLSYLKPTIIVMIDDREEHLDDIRQFCAKNSIKFVGILFKGLEKLSDIQDSRITDFQEKHLIEHAKWLEDEEAEAMLKQCEASLSKPKL